MKNSLALFRLTQHCLIPQNQHSTEGLPNTSSVFPRMTINIICIYAHYAKYTWRFAVFLICCQQTAKIIDLLSANRQQTAKNIPYEKVSFIEKIL